MHQQFKPKHLLLFILLIIGLILRVGIALKLPNIFWADEIFQTLEPAHRLAFGNSIVTWEFRDGIRSWVLPGILSIIMNLTQFLGSGSTGYLTGIIIFLSLISLSIIIVAYYWGYEIGGKITALTCAIICAIWFEIIYFSPKGLTEVIATHFLLPGMFLATRKSDFPDGKRLFTAGIILGISLCLRIHLLPSVIFLLIYICRRQFKLKWLPMLLGVIASLLVFGVVDAFTWSYPFQSFWLNIWVNVVEGRSKLYGVSPWYEYGIFLFKSWSWFIIPITIFIIIGARHCPILLWSGLIIILSHSILDHKEYRFIYPALPMFMILAGIGTSEILTQLINKLTKPQIFFLPKNFISFFVAILLWVNISLPLSTRFNVYQDVKFSIFSSDIKNTHWYGIANNLLAMQSLSQEKNVCGVGLWNIHWALSGGYTYLHHNVPVFSVETNKDFQELYSGFNYVVAALPLPSQYQNYQLKQCWEGTCIYQRPGSCNRIVDRDINYILKQSGN